MINIFCIGGENPIKSYKLPGGNFKLKKSSKKKTIEAYNALYKPPLISH